MIPNLYCNLYVMDNVNSFPGPQNVDNQLPIHRPVRATRSGFCMQNVIFVTRALGYVIQSEN